MHISVLLPENPQCRDLEQTVFAFTNRLSQHCASIDSCDIVIEWTLADESSSTFFVKANLSVFAQSVHVIGQATAARPEEALKQALDSVAAKAWAKLDPIRGEHAGCGCDAAPPDKEWDSSVGDSLRRTPS